MKYFNFESALKSPQRRVNYYALRSIARESIDEFMNIYTTSDAVEDRQASRILCQIALSVLERNSKPDSLFVRLAHFVAQKHGTPVALTRKLDDPDGQLSLYSNWDASLVRVLMEPVETRS
jgi:hypothetical protein